jgi:hypothetical protein
MVGPKTRDGAIIDLDGVSSRASELLIWGEAVDVDILKTLPRLETLEVYKIRPKDVPKVQRLEEISLDNLSLRFWPEPDLTAFRPPRGLKGLTVWQSKKLVRLDGIEAASDLETLVLSDNGRLETLAPIRALPKLSGLHLSGGIWTKQETGGLEALDGLATLTRLQLRGLKGGDIDLTPVTRLPALEWLDLWPRDFPMAELAKVAAAYPFYLKELLELPDYGIRDRFGVCDTCGAMRKMMFLRGRKMLWCPSCEKAGIERLLETFRAAIEDARSELGLPRQP